jgi:hypothetical protein
MLDPLYAIKHTQLLIRSYDGERDSASIIQLLGDIAGDVRIISSHFKQFFRGISILPH